MTPCQNNGNCTWHGGHNFTCDCLDGYEGPFCSGVATYRALPLVIPVAIATIGVLTLLSCFVCCWICIASIKERRKKKKKDEDEISTSANWMDGKEAQKSRHWKPNMPDLPEITISDIYETVKLDDDK